MHNPDIPAPMIATFNKRFSDTVTPWTLAARMAQRYAGPRWY
jgi:hypothetical protein